MTVDIGRILADIGRRLAKVEAQSRLKSASIDDAALLVRDGTGSLRGIVGQQGDGTTAVTIVNGPPPPQPSAPIVTSVLGGVAASWDGQFTDGQVLPLDWSRVEVHASTDPGFVPFAGTLHSTIETAQGATVIVATDDPVYVRLLARSTSGTASPPSTPTGPHGPTPVVATELLDGIVTTVKLADDAVTAAKVAAAAVTPDALAPVLADTVSQRWVDTMDDPAAWTLVAQETGATWSHQTVTDASVGGGSVGQAAGYVGVRGTTLIPHDPSTMYRISVRIRASPEPAAGPDTCYLGLIGFAADRTTMVNRAGADSVDSQYYPVARLQAVAAADGWTVYTGFIQGRGAPATSVGGGPAPDPLAPEPLHSQVRFITPYLLLNYTRRDNAGIMQVDTVSVEALRTGVVTAAYLAAGSVSTSKLVAGAVQTAQLDAEAVNASKIAAGAVTTAKLDALAVTADKIAANTITTAKLAAGSVDATALKADAITGKTITGGVINGAEFHSDDGAGGLVDIESGTVLTTASTGWRIAIDPSKPQPAVVWLNDTGVIAGEINGMGDSTRPGLVLSSGPFTDGAVTDWRWATRSGADGAINGWRTGRFRESDQNTILGGYINLAPDKATLAWIDTANSATNTILQISQGLFVFDEGRFVIEPPVSSAPAFHLAAQTGHTGHLIRAQVNLVNQFVVTAGGAVTATGSVTGASFTTAGSVNAATVTTTSNATVGGTLGIANATVSGQITKDATWSTLSTGTGWAGYGGAYGIGRYRRMPDGSVVIRDLINRTASTTIPSGEIVATLPVGYRPVTQVQQNIFVGGSSGGSLSININTNGTITLTNITPGAVTYLSTGSGYISLNGYQFFTD
ncbi:hypothetical protein [Streptomyces sp. rh34]|uniref:hypothetical protein n=1 Tax=Streptomyces sp. rh34 TaxID=2034272 RepID=UPI000BEF5D77|nr:hypothetical protein [Streptomyces sp. rh34]